MKAYLTKNYALNSTKKSEYLPDIHNEIYLRPKKIATSLGIISLFLAFTSLGTNLVTSLTGHDYLHGLLPFFYVDHEKNVPTAYSVFLLLFASVLLLIISILKWKQSRSSAFYWIVLLSGFSFMSMDEAWGFHELIDQPGSFFDSSKFNGLLNFAWIIPFLFILPVLLIFFWKFLSGLPRKTRLYFLISALIYLGGAIGFESLGGYLVESIGRKNWWYYLTVTSEETFEMGGAILFIYALLNYMHFSYKKVSFLIPEK